MAVSIRTQFCVEFIWCSVCFHFSFPSLFLFQIENGTVTNKMSIQCGICKNVMPSASFMNHKERKHSLLDHVPYVRVTDDQVRKVDSNDRTSAASVAATIIAAGPLVKCRFCPNRLSKGAMERHLQRCHIDCHLCGKTLLKSNRANHMKQKHGQDAPTSTAAPAAVNVIAKSDTMSNSSSSSNGDLREMAVLSQSKSSVESDSDGSIAAATSNVNLSPVFDAPAVQMPFKSYASSLTSSVTSLLSSTPPPPSPPVTSQTPAKPTKPTPTIKPSNPLHKQTTPSSSVLPPTQEPNVIHVDIWQLSRYMRQGRVYKSNGWLYLRNSTINPM